MCIHVPLLVTHSTYVLLPSFRHPAPPSAMTTNPLAKPPPCTIVRPLIFSVKYLLLSYTAPEVGMHCCFTVETKAYTQRSSRSVLAWKSSRPDCSHELPKRNSLSPSILSPSNPSPLIPLSKNLACAEIRVRFCSTNSRPFAGVVTLFGPTDRPQLTHRSRCGGEGKL